ncbi:MAG: aminotransferase, partial [Chloroflexi bacterium]|nr:aminotransferase [Chloroflexota bacterium]
MAAVDSAVVEAARDRYVAARAAGLDLDMTRGKPSPEQLARSHGLLRAVDREDDPAADGTDCRNYGGDPRGLPEMRAIFAGILGVDPELVFVGGNASLQWMHDLIVQAMLVGVPGGDPWGGPRRSTPVKFLCPCPGYDRHFSVLERFGIEMLLIGMGDDGPDVDEIARLAGEDPNVKGMFCVPRYSNPTGVTYSDDVVEAIAEMKTAAPDFRVIWDDAYALHAFEG